MMEKTNIYHPTKRQEMLWNAAGNIIYLACQWLITVLVTVLGGLHDAGVLSVAMSVSATFQTVALFGIRNFQVSDTDAKYRDSTYVAFRTVTCTLAFVVCLVFSLINRYFGAQLLAICLFMLFRLSECFSDVLHGIAQKNNRLDIAGKSFGAKGIGLIICFLAGFLLSKQLNAGLAAMSLFSLSVTVFYDLPAVKRLASFRLLAPLGEQIPLAKETLPLCVYLFLYAALSTVPKLILEKMSGEEVLGAYSSVFAPAMLLQAATGYLYTPFATEMGVLFKEKRYREFRSLLYKISAVLIAVFAVILVLAQFLGEFALVLVFGEQLRAYTYLLTPILLVNLVISFLGLYSMAVIVLRKFKILLSGYAIGFVLVVLLPMPAIRYFGTNGTSWALIAAGCAVLALLICGALFTESTDKKDKIKKDFS